MKRKNQSGFTLVEVSVGALIMIVIGFGILGLQYAITNFQVFSFDSFLSVESAGSALNTMTKEIRKIQSGENGSYGIDTADDNLFIFYSDVDFDDQAERITYQLVNGELLRSVVQPTGSPLSYDDNTATTRVLARNVQNTGTPVFFYFNGDWPEDTTNNPLGTPADLLEVKLVQIVVVINEGNEDRQEFQLDSFVHLRTLKNNL